MRRGWCAKVIKTRPDQRHPSRRTNSWTFILVLSKQKICTAQHIQNTTMSKKRSWGIWKSENVFVLSLIIHQRNLETNSNLFLNCSIMFVIWLPVISFGFFEQICQLFAWYNFFGYYLISRKWPGSNFIVPIEIFSPNCICWLRKLLKLKIYFLVYCSLYHILNR